MAPEETAVCALTFHTVVMARITVSVMSMAMTIAVISRGAPARSINSSPVTTETMTSGMTIKRCWRLPT